MKKQNRLYPPRMIGMMTGTQYIVLSGKSVTLTYVDGTTETTALKIIPEDYMQIVSAVQSKRGNTVNV